MCRSPKFTRVPSDLGRARIDVAGVGSKVVQTADGTNRICSCARLRVFDPCNPPPAEEAWNEFGSCGPECQGVGESRSILVLPVPPVDDDNNPAGCSNGQCWDLKACWAPVTPAELGIEVPEAVRSASFLVPRVCICSASMPLTCAGGVAPWPAALTVLKRMRRLSREG